MSQIQPINPHHSLAGDNAMTEIALALAMGFFAIMILTLVSMGAGASSDKTVETSDEAEKTFISAALAPVENKDKQPSNSTQSNVKKDDLLVIYYNGEFVDQNLAAVDLRNLDFSSDRRVILALNPSLPMSEAMTVRTKLPTENLIISALDERWLTRLSEQSLTNQNLQ